MTQFQYSTGSFRVSRTPTTHTPQQRLFGIAFAIAMEGAIIYALLAALGYAPAPPMVPDNLIIVNLRPPEKIDNTPPPPPVTIEAPRVELITPVVELTYVPPPSLTAISVPPPLPVPTTTPRVPPPTPPVVFTPPRAIAASHTIPEYPFVSRRLREQGTLRLKLTVDEKGLITEAILVNSSGFQRLDEAAVNWVKARWRYTPAMQGTKAVPSTAEAIVEFRLQ